MSSFLESVSARAELERYAAEKRRMDKFKDLFQRYTGVEADDYWTHQGTPMARVQDGNREWFFILNEGKEKTGIELIKHYTTLAVERYLSPQVAFSAQDLHALLYYYSLVDPT